MRTGLALLLAAVTAVACAASQPPPRLDESGAIAVARAEVARRETGWKDVEYSARASAESWVVTAWRLPKTPGGTRVITVGTDGKVLRYERGE